MITKQQAINLKHRQELHYTGKQECARMVGLKGGIIEKIVRVRVSGKCQTWKTRPDKFRVPVKYGLYENGEITHRNAIDFHLPSHCHLNDPTKP